MSRSGRGTERDAVTRRELLGGRFLAALRGERIGAASSDRGRRGLPAPARGAAIVRLDEAPESESGRPEGGRRRPRGGFPILRPPGAIAEREFLARCSRCDACIEACPHDAILPAPPRFREAAGTPMIAPLRQPCLLCSDTPCVTACEEGALIAGLPPRLGRAMVDRSECLAYRSSPCSICVDRCPVEGAMRLVDGRPIVDDARCTGCGICQHVCPAPVNAILVLPELHRPIALEAREE